jgi:hypothetical protein
MPNGLVLSNLLICLSSAILNLVVDESHIRRRSPWIDTPRQMGIQKCMSASINSWGFKGAFHEALFLVKTMRHVEV